MGLLDNLRERWLRGRSAHAPEAAGEERVARILTTPDEASQVQELPGAQREQLLDESRPDEGAAPQR